MSRDPVGCTYVIHTDEMLAIASSSTFSMLDGLQRYLHKRRRGFIQSVTFLCGSYAVSAHVSQRLEEMKDKMVRNKLARDKCVLFVFYRADSLTFVRAR